MSFSIIVLSKNIDNLRACVAAIRSSGETARVFVIWDGELFDTVEEMPFQLDRDGVEMLSGAQPFCFARNVNIGIKAAGGDDVVLLNDDCLVVPYEDSLPLSRLVDALYSDQHGEVRTPVNCTRPLPWGVLSPRVTSPAALQHSYPDDCSFPARKGLEEITDVTSFRMVPFVCVAIRRQVIDAVGLLDERFCGKIGSPSTLGNATAQFTEEVYGGEDDDYCYRVRQAGLRLGVLNTWVADHKTLKSTFRPDGKGRSAAGARQRFYEIHGFGMGTR